MDFKKELFKLFAKNMGEYELYNAIVKLNKECTRETLGRKMSNIYSELTKIPVSYSLNEKEMKLERDILNKIKSDIVYEYEDFLFILIVR
jgi:hypothetical protein